jgi:flagellar protein FlgJ
MFINNPQPINSLASERYGSSENKSENLNAVAEQFEAIFVEQFLKAARQSTLADGLFNNQETETYREMLDKEYAKQIANNTALGIASAIQQQFSKHLKED